MSPMPPSTGAPHGDTLGSPHKRRVLVALAAVIAAVSLAPPAVAARFPPATMLLSRASGGGLPNGPSCCGSVSRDERIGRVIAFESLATDIAQPVRRGTANVFAVVRRGPWTTNGSPWVAGSTLVVSRGLHGRAANGASFAPHVSGDSAHVPRCVAFLSRASNLVRGDHNHRVDAFVADLVSARITRVSVDSTGAEVDGDVSDVAVDGACTRVAFVSTAGRLSRMTGHERGRWPGAATRPPTAGRPQVYVHFLDRGGQRTKRLAGLTLLVSRAGRTPADTGAGQLAFSSDGRTVSYVSAAANLGTPTGGVAQVWQGRIATTPRAGGRTRVAVRTRLVSRTPQGHAASGPSITPSATYDGRVVAFATTAPELTEGASAWQVVLADRTKPSALPTIASKSQFIPSPQNNHRGPPPVPGNAPSLDPQISEGGQWAFFDSRATNLVVGGSGIVTPQREVYRWTDPSLRAIADLSGVQLKSLMGSGTGGGYYSVTPAVAPAASARGNYLTFESEDPRLDPVALAATPVWGYEAISARRHGELYPGLPASQLAQLPGAGGQHDPTLPTAPGETRLHQVYLRYLGPK